MTPALRINVVIAFLLTISSAGFFGWLIGAYYSKKIIDALRQRCGLVHPPGWARATRANDHGLVSVGHAQMSPQKRQSQTAECNPHVDRCDSPDRGSPYWPIVNVAWSANQRCVVRVRLERSKA